MAWDFAVLIPSHDRAVLLERNLGRMPFLNEKNVMFAVHDTEWSAYEACRKLTRKADWQKVHNPTGSVAVMRQALKASCHFLLNPDWYVVTDDNAVYTKKSLLNLVECARCYPHDPCTIAGMHQTAAHFDEREIATTSEIHGGMQSYAKVSMMFQVYPKTLYNRYTYPADAFGLDDRHFYLWAVSQGVRHFRVCMDAPFSKKRYEVDKHGKGGQGLAPQRARMNGLGVARLAADFPEMVGAGGTLRIEWKLIMAMQEGAVPDRLAGGAMRSADRIIAKAAAPAPSSGLRARVRRVPYSPF